MKTHWQTNFVAILLATFLFGSNVIGLHSLTHNDDLTPHTDCEYCTFLIQKEVHDAVVFETHSFLTNDYTENFAIVSTIYPFVTIKNISLSTWFTRPPPSLI